MGPRNVLNDTKLILDYQGDHLDSFGINLESFRSFRGPIFYRPVTGQVLFLATQYKKQALKELQKDSVLQIYLHKDEL